MYNYRNRRYTRSSRRRYPRKTRKWNSRKRYTRGGSRGKRLTDGTIYRFKRTFLYTSISSSATIGNVVFGSFNFSLDDVTNFTEFTTLFDSFKISGVKLKFIPRQTDNDSLVTSPGQFMYVPDYDDDTIPVNVLEIMERQSHKIQQMPGSPFSIFLRPRPSAAATVAGQFQMNSNAYWLKSSVSQATPHYGLKYAWSLSNSVQTMEVYATYYLKFKAVK